MEFKYSVGDTIYLKPYNQVKYHLGISQRIWEFISKVPLTIIHIPQDRDIYYVLCYQDRAKYAIKLDAIIPVENRILPDITDMI